MALRILADLGSVLLLAIDFGRSRVSDLRFSTDRLWVTCRRSGLGVELGPAGGEGVEEDGTGEAVSR